MRIVSLVPSITETLFDFGLNASEVIGRTKFCIHPHDRVKDVAIVGGTKNVNIEQIRQLKPDLIITNKEENEKIQVEELMHDHKVWVTDIENLEDNRIFLKQLGEILNREKLAEDFIQQTDQLFCTPESTRKKVAYLIWRNPYMTIGNDTFIHAILHANGFENVFGDHKRYPQINFDDLKAADFIFLSSEPFPFSQKHIDEIKEELPDAEILLVDGEAFSWYGTHILKCKDYYRSLREKFL